MIAWPQCIDKDRFNTQTTMTAYVAMNRQQWLSTLQWTDNNDCLHCNEQTTMTAYVAMNRQQWQPTWQWTDNNDSLRGNEQTTMTAYVAMNRQQWQPTWLWTDNNDCLRGNEQTTMTAYVAMTGCNVLTWVSCVHPSQWRRKHSAANLFFNANIYFFARQMGHLRSQSLHGQSDTHGQQKTSHK